jgi:hypothetical protein
MCGVNQLSNQISENSNNNYEKNKRKKVNTTQNDCLLGSVKKTTYSRKESSSLFHCQIKYSATMKLSKEIVRINLNT